ncbi:MAG: hypothetical protein LBF94_01350 [Puniceicoccales bacterium]|jgi:hypothetical protein|nr:hypothetical protein [Puniceicoccales bacterium]
MVQSSNNGHFEFLLPPTQRWFSPKEVAAIIGKSAQYVRDAFDNQKILGHTMSGRAPKGKEKRKTYQISRESLMLYLIETANYTSDEFLLKLRDIFSNCSTAQLLKLQNEIEHLLKIK